MESFRRHHNIGFYTKSGERGDVSEPVVSDWIEKLPNLVEGYDPKDIYNMGETGLFFHTTRGETLYEKGKDCSGGKKTKVRLTASLCANMIGVKEKPLVIWKYQNPHCFKGINPTQFPVEYYAYKSLDDFRDAVEEI